MPQTAVLNIETRHRDRASTSLERLRRRLEDTKVSVGGVTTSLAGLATAATAVAAAVAAATAALGAVVAATQQWAQTLSLQSRQTGIAVENLAALQFAYRQVGLEADDVGEAVRELNLKLGEAVFGEAPAIEAFESIGLDIQRLRRLRPEQLLEEVGEAMSDVRLQSDRAAAASRLFGDDLGSRLLPALELGRQGLQDYARDAEALGIVVNDRFIAQSNAFNEALGELGGLFQGVGIQISQELFPVFTDLIRDILPDLLDLFDGLVPIIVDFGRVIAAVVRPVADLLGLLGRLLEPLSNVQSRFRVATEAVDEYRSAIGGTASATVEELRNTASAIVGEESNFNTAGSRLGTALREGVIQGLGAALSNGGGESGGSIGDILSSGEFDVSNVTDIPIIGGIAAFFAREMQRVGLSTPGGRVLEERERVLYNVQPGEDISLNAQDIAGFREELGVTPYLSTLFTNRLFTNLSERANRREGGAYTLGDLQDDYDIAQRDAALLRQYQIRGLDIPQRPDNYAGISWIYPFEQPLEFWSNRLEDISRISGGNIGGLHPAIENAIYPRSVSPITSGIANWAAAFAANPGDLGTGIDDESVNQQLRYDRLVERLRARNAQPAAGVGFADTRSIEERLGIGLFDPFIRQQQASFSITGARGNLGEDVGNDLTYLRDLLRHSITVEVDEIVSLFNAGILPTDEFDRILNSVTDLYASLEEGIDQIAQRLRVGVFDPAISRLGSDLALAQSRINIFGGDEGSLTGLFNEQLRNVTQEAIELEGRRDRGTISEELFQTQFHELGDLAAALRAFIEQQQQQQEAESQPVIINLYRNDDTLLQTVQTALLNGQLTTTVSNADAPY